MRKTIIAGNWKMNKTRQEAVSFFNELKKLIDKDSKAEIIIATPYTVLETALKETLGTDINISSENINENEKGAYTGEISADMLLDLGVNYTLIGHSERRTYYNEDNESVNKKVITSINKNIVPIICVGETLNERESNLTENVLKLQIRKAYENVSKEDALKTIVAYEPVWAIGTGKTASPEIAEEAHKYIRSLLFELFGENAEKIQILYGGSMNENNAKELLAQENIDGGLIGGASLVPEKFSTIINYVK